MKRCIFIAFCAVLGIILVFIAVTTGNIVAYSYKDETRLADAAIVPGAATYGGEVSPVYKGRLNHALSLYNEGLVSALILTGGVGEGNEISDAAAARDYVIKEGADPRDVFIEELSTITEENLNNAKEIMDEENFADAVIVSDPLHMKRTMLMAKDIGITAFSSPTPDSAYKSLKTKIPFLAREEFFYAGYLFYRLFAY